MDTQNPSAHPRAQSRTSGKNHPRRGPRANTHPSGVIHDNTRHTTRFTVIGNHLAQHQELSGLAIGLAVYIQSVPAGAPVGIKTLADRFPESPARIAAALRELETHGYLRRTRERTESGRIVTRTVSCNQPGRHGDATDDAPNPSPARRAGEQRKKPPRRALPASRDERPGARGSRDRAGGPTGAERRTGRGHEGSRVPVAIAEESTDIADLH